MKFLVDMPLSPGLARWLVEQGHEAVHASLVGLATATDERILTTALETGSVVITADLDYPRLLATMALVAPGVIVYRGGNLNEHEAYEFARRVLAVITANDLQNSLVVVDRARIRLRRLPLHSP